MSSRIASDFPVVVMEPENVGISLNLLVRIIGCIQIGVPLANAGIWESGETGKTVLTRAHAIPLIASVFATAIALQAQPPLPAQLTGAPVITNVTFAEGPVFDPQGNLYFVNYKKNGNIGRMAPDGTQSVWVTLPPGAFPFGLKLDGLGNLYATDFGAGHIYRISPARQVTSLPDSFKGPNDLCFDHAGNLFFTDLSGGAIYRYTPSGKLTQIASKISAPNGIVVDADQTTLYVSDTGTNSILTFDLAPDGTLSNRRTLYRYATASVDGISFDEYGRLWVARLDNKSVDVLSRDGKPLASYRVGGEQSSVTNMAWFDKKLYVTNKGENNIYRFDMGFDGAPVIPAPASHPGVSAASGSLTVAPDSLGSVFSGAGANSTATITDSSGSTYAAPVLYASPAQVNFLVPGEVATGAATLEVVTAGLTMNATLQIANTAPGIFTSDGSGQGLPAAYLQRSRANGSQAFEAITAAPIDFGADQLYLILFGTGIRRADPSRVSARVASTIASVLYAGAQGDFAGLDQVNLTLPRTLRGSGDVEVVLTVDRDTANPVRISIR